MAFQFKQFSIEQKVNAHKVGTDSMLLGAWVKGNFSNILDIGTGTGILALMQAQKNPLAKVIGIESNALSCAEAKGNFANSPFDKRMSAVCTKLQDFNIAQPFDLIIANPPYFVDAYLGKETAKNQARHTINLSIEALYKHAERLLHATGQLSVVIPSSVKEMHFKVAAQYGLFPADILVILSEDKTTIRHLITFNRAASKPIENTMIAKYNNGMYSKAYVTLTVDYHDRELTWFEDKK
ncbi:methyltransferase [Putridiphycobacter roseus]|uniref:Methyltransferase n=1 Tax=Putridiphycobacter roseus TaxID=2219161 RepID=A0A2W1N029_9FLAO|nr:methyltransferase [Putridiphycobacter roseus]PZE17859.1 methyltransferase [Putridiphycobacter roseus]